ncbi:MAG: DNA mismatch repair endonuclease MutL [Armatimonadetes bacterium]|nr:DNA mismatch repair endonuclease MutL [Armatimonadota bacterium]
MTGEFPPRVRLLPGALADRIAAGEVVARPAAVVKELVENALDAGATRIAVEADGGGLTRIRVSDNGWGMRPEDAVLSLQRHATSKIASDTDLERVGTYGFRGEALSSIAAVSELRLTTACGLGEGVRLTAFRGQIEAMETVGAPRGTVVEIERLYESVPTRRDFLRSPRAEGDRIAETVERLLLARPDAAWHLVMDGAEGLRWPGGTRADAALQVLGRDTFSRMRPVESASGPVRLAGWLSLPSRTRPHRGGQYFYVNGRFVRHPLLMRAVDEAYAGQIPAGRHPAVALFWQVPPDRVDVNLHPAKSEVRFRDEADLYRMTRAALLAVLGNAPESAAGATGPDAEGARGPGWWAALRPLGQLCRLYLVAESPDGLALIDQHAAHERLLFERMAAGPPELFDPPVVAHLTPAQGRAMARCREGLARAGLKGEPFGRDTWLIRAAPCGVSRAEAPEAVSALLDAAEEAPSESELVGLRAAAACRLAYRAGLWLSDEEIGGLLAELARCREPWRCPHGRPTLLVWGESDLAGFFRRV